MSPELLPRGSKEREAANAVNEAARAGGRWLSDLEPEVVVIVSPHGVELSKDFAIYLNSEAQGYADLGKDLHNASIRPKRLSIQDVNLAPALSRRLLAYLVNDGHNVTGVQSFADSEPAELRWGEILPLSFVLMPSQRKDLSGHRNLSSSSSNRRKFSVIVVSVPLRRYKYAPMMVPELLEFGFAIGKFLGGLAQSAALLVSADLAHTHLATGPYGYNRHASTFDKLVGSWALNPITNAQRLLRGKLGYCSKHCHMDL